MPTATRPADAVEAMVARVFEEMSGAGPQTPKQLRSTFEKAGIGPKDGAGVLRRLTELGVVIGGEDDKSSTTRRTAAPKTATTRPTTRTKAATRPAGRTGESTVTLTESPAVEPVLDTPTTSESAPAPKARATRKKAAPAPVAAPAPAAEDDDDVDAAATDIAAEMAEEDKPLALDEPPPGIDLVKAYLREIGRVALLTAVEEVDLAKRIEAGLFAQEKLRMNAEEGLKLTPTVKRDLAWVARDGDKAKRHLLEANLRLVVSLAKRYQGRGLDLLDLVQEGNLGLVRAVEKFDYAKGYKFSTYATWRIHQVA